MKPSLLHTIRDHAFVASVSIAAFTHSSWSLATVFGGHEPGFGPAWVGWIVPAALIAGSIDIGLLSLATQIQDPKERNWGRVISFVLLAAGMFALQGLYVASHMPVIPLAEGVRAEWAQSAGLFRDSMLIVVPGLLPLALILHTISGSRKAELPSSSPQLAPLTIETVDNQTTAIVPKEIEYVDRITTLIEVQCDQCDWVNSYPDNRAARMGLMGHKRQMHREKEPVEA
jgi:hypothetical protein